MGLGIFLFFSGEFQSWEGRCHYQFVPDIFFWVPELNDWRTMGGFIHNNSNSRDRERQRERPKEKEKMEMEE